MIDFMEAVKRPLRTDPITLLLGVLFTVPFSAPLFSILRPLMHGFGLEAARRTQHANAQMPTFDDFVDLFLSGLIVYVIAIIYFLPAILVLIAGAVSSFPMVLTVLQNLAVSPALAMRSFIALVINGAVFGAIALALGFLASIMAPVGVQLFAHDKKVGSAFNFDKIWAVVSTSQYWVTWLLMMGYGIVLVGVISVLSIPEFNALSVLFFGAAAYMWWMTWYIMLAETVKDTGVLDSRGHTHAVTHPAHATHVHSKAKGRFAYKRK